MTSTYKLLVIDIDGTLVLNSGEVSAENRAALAAVRRAGIPVALCTGRSIVSCRHYISELSLGDGYHMFFDGALVTRVDDEEPVYAVNIEPAMVRAMVEYAETRDIDLELSTTNLYYARRETWSTRVKHEYFGIEAIIGNLTGIWERERIIRGDLVVRNPATELKANLFIDHFLGKLQFTQAYSPRFPDVRFVNAVARGMSKGKALEALTAHLGIDTGDVMAVGDWLNDVPLISAAGLGVAMGNGHDDLKRIADYVTLSVDEHGLAEAINRFLLS